MSPVIFRDPRYDRRGDVKIIELIYILLYIAFVYALGLELFGHVIVTVDLVAPLLEDYGVKLGITVTWHLYIGLAEGGRMDHFPSISATGITVCGLPVLFIFMMTVRFTLEHLLDAAFLDFLQNTIEFDPSLDMFKELFIE